MFKRLQVWLARLSVFNFYNLPITWRGSILSSISNLEMYNR
jgi:hypothetical protein